MGCTEVVASNSVDKSSEVIMAKKAMKAMKKGMKAMKGVKSMPKSGIADALGEACEAKRSAMSKALDALAELAAKEVKCKAKPARTVVKAFAVAAIKKSV